LRDGGDTCGEGVTRRAEADRLAIDKDLALIGLVDAADDLGQGRLSGAILPNQPMHFPGANGQRNLIERLDAAEALGEVARFDEGRVLDCVGRIHGRRGPLSRSPSPQPSPVEPEEGVPTSKGRQGWQLDSRPRSPLPARRERGWG